MSTDDSGVGTREGSDIDRSPEVQYVAPKGIKVLSIRSAGTRTEADEGGNGDVREDLDSVGVRRTDVTSGRKIEDLKLLEWFEWATQKRQEGMDFNERMEANKEFRNPAILEKMVAYCDLDEYGTEFVENVFHPRGFADSEFSDALLATQRARMEGSAGTSPKGSGATQPSEKASPRTHFSRRKRLRR